MEQDIITSSGQRVKPDMVASSNKLLSYFVCDCKGGKTVDGDQLVRYSTLRNQDFELWIHAYAPNDFEVDFCLADFEANHGSIAARATGFPILTFTDSVLFKTGNFSNDRLNEEFRNPISLDGKIPPLLYYPFSVEDSNSYIAPFVIRGMVSVALRKARWNSDQDNPLELSIMQEEIVESIFHPVFDALSQDNKRQLRKKIRLVIKWISEDIALRDFFEVIEKEGTVKINRPLARLQEASESFIKKLETERPLLDFLKVDGGAKSAQSTG